MNHKNRGEDPKTEKNDNPIVGPELQENLKNLKEINVSENEIKNASQDPELLDPELRENLKNLKEGINVSEIEIKDASQDPEFLDNLRENLKNLKEGINVSEIEIKDASQDPETMDPETKQKHYNHLRRYLSQEEVGENAELLDYPTETIEGNIQYLTSFGVEYNPEGDNSSIDLLRSRPSTKSYIDLLRSHPSTKRKRVAWFARDIFDIDSEEVDKEKRYNAVKEFIRDHPGCLTSSISSLRDKREKFERIAGDYIENTEA